MLVSPNGSSRATRMVLFSFSAYRNSVSHSGEFASAWTAGNHRLTTSVGLLQRLLPPFPRPDTGVRVQIQIDLLGQTRFLLDQPLLDRHRLAAVPAGMAQEHPRHASPPRHSIRTRNRAPPRIVAPTRRLACRTGAICRNA